MHEPGDLLDVRLRFDELKLAEKTLRNVAEVLLQSWADKCMLTGVADKLRATYEIKPSVK